MSNDNPIRFIEPTLRAGGWRNTTSRYGSLSIGRIDSSELLPELTCCLT
jgi:hypothetical protein